MDKTLSLPYTKSPLDKDFKIESSKYFKYLKNIFTPYFKKRLSSSKYIKMNNFLYPNPRDHIEGIKSLREKAGFAKNPRFLYFDIKKFYPSVNHNILKRLVLKHYLYSRGCKNLEDKTLEQLLQNKKLSRYFKYFLNYLEQYLSYSNFKGVGLLSSNSVTYILAELYLYDVFVNTKVHFFRRNDDMIIFCREKTDIKDIFTNVILKNINNLELKINPDKIYEGVLFKDNLYYIGFHFKAGNTIVINPDKIKEYLDKVKQIFYNNPYTKIKTKINKLRNLQFGFFYYYRICKLKYIWDSINSKTRQIFRSYLLEYKKEYKNFLFIKNNTLYKFGIIDFLKLKF